MQRIRPNSRLLLGGWAYTAKTGALAPPGMTPGRTRNSGAYVRGEALVSDSVGKLMAFGRIGIADEDVNLFSSFYSGGLTWESFSERRPDDEMGLAFAWAEASENAPVNAENREASVELTYRLQISDWLAVQPNLHYVINPGLDPGLDNAWVVGVRFELR
jgi:porin